MKMKYGTRSGNIVAENLAAYAPHQHAISQWGRRFCWTCSKDVPLYGGKIIGRIGIHGSPVRFTCAACLAALGAKNPDAA